MKLIIAIVHNDDASFLNHALLQSKYFATKLSTTGGFLKAGNTTFLIGCDDDQVDPAIKIIEQTCKRRSEVIPSSVATPFAAGIYSGVNIEVTIGGATVFVLPVERFEKL